MNYLQTLFTNQMVRIIITSCQSGTFNRTLVLREVTLNYDLPKSTLGKTFINDLSIFFTGRNLFLITKSFTDPELNASEGSYTSNLSQGLEIEAQMPQTKSFGAGIRVKF